FEPQWREDYSTEKPLAFIGTAPLSISVLTKRLRKSEPVRSGLTRSGPKGSMRPLSDRTVIALVAAACGLGANEGCVLLGQKSPIQLLASNPASPCSSAVSTSGRTADLWRARMAIGLTAPDLM